MKVNLVAPFASLGAGSIRDFELPNLSLICGLNGSGKTQLLQALSNLQYSTILSDSGSDIGNRRFLTIADLTTDGGTGLQGTRTATDLHEAYSQGLQVVSRAYSVEYGEDESRPVYTPEDFEARCKSYFERTGLMSGDALDYMVRQSGHTFSELTPDDFRVYGPLAGSIDPFTVSLTNLFAAYRREEHENQLAGFYEERGGPKAPSREEFLKQYGDPPWEIAERAMEVMGLRYKAMPPPDRWVPDDGLADYVAEFESDDGQLIRAEAFSTGEKVILRIACCMFEFEPPHLGPQMPNLLLLDEIDAVLHPSLVLTLLKVLKEVLIIQRRLHVVLTTHSPVTVALAPEDSVFEMRRSAPRLRSIDKDRAVQSLSFGVPTLAVRVENQRQVFVESSYDQAVHNIYYNVLKAQLHSEISLNFIPAGDATGGNDRVADLVNGLRGSGVDTVLGLIDKDKRETYPPNLAYVAGRYAVENIVLDPLQVGAYLLRQHKLSNSKVGLPAGATYFNLADDEKQLVVDYIAKVVGEEADRSEEQYCGGFALRVPRYFLEAHKDELRPRLTTAIPELTGLFRDKRYLEQIASYVARELPAYVPQAVLDCYGYLLGIAR